MHKIAGIGAYDSCYGFAAVGRTTFPVEMNTEPEDAAKTLRNIAESDYGVIYVTEALAAMLSKEIARYKNRLTPAIIEIPGVRGNTGEGIRGVKRTVEQAVGSDILFGDN